MKLTEDQKLELTKNQQFLDVFVELSTQRFPDTSSPAIFETMFATMEFAIDYSIALVDRILKEGTGDIDYLQWMLRRDYGLVDASDE